MTRGWWREALFNFCYNESPIVKNPCWRNPQVSNERADDYNNKRINNKPLIFTEYPVGR